MGLFAESPFVGAVVVVYEDLYKENLEKSGLPWAQNTLEPAQSLNLVLLVRYCTLDALVSISPYLSSAR